MRSNPLPIFVPCHRVIAACGGPGGFNGGLPLKRRLLRREKMYATEAALAEMGLKVIAEELDGIAAAFEPIRGKQRNTFASQARNVWRTLYRHNPSKRLYAERLRRQPPKRPSSPPLHKKDDGHGH